MKPRLILLVLCLAGNVLLATAVLHKEFRSSPPANSSAPKVSSTAKPHSINNWSDADNDADTIKQIEQNKKDMQAEIATALGADKAQELERTQDYNYQQLNSLANHYDLPTDTATKVYDFKGAAEKAVQDLSANTDLTPEQQQAARAQIKTETEQAVKTALGSDRIYKRYMNNGGWWLNNLAPPPPKQN